MATEGPMEDITGTGGNSAAASADAGTASPAVQSQTATATDASSAVQSAQATGITDTTPREGFIPRDRFDEVNTKKAELERQLAEYREKHGWAESVQRDQLEQMAQWYSRYNGDAGEFMESILQESLQHPVHGASVKSRLGRMLAQLRQQQSQPEPIEAGIPVMNDKGDIVARTFTDAQINQLLQQKLDAALSPFKEDLDTRKSQAQKAQERAQVEAKADADVAYVKKRPGFAKFQKEILATFSANPNMTIRDAYDAVMDSKLPQEAEAKVLSDLQQKANAQTVGSSAPSSSAPPKFKNFAEAHAYYEKHPDEAKAMANR
jgi:hypothetical protein